MTDPLAQERIRYALLRDGERWADVSLDGLEVFPDGTIELRRLPAITPPHVLTPGGADPSGLALDDQCGLYISDAPGRRLIREALDCHDRLVIPGMSDGGSPFEEPRGGRVQRPLRILLKQK